MRYALHEVAGQYAITEIDEKTERLYATTPRRDAAVRILNFLNDEAREITHEPRKPILPHAYSPDDSELAACRICGYFWGHFAHHQSGIDC